MRIDAPPTVPISSMRVMSGLEMEPPNSGVDCAWHELPAHEGRSVLAGIPAARFSRWETRDFACTAHGGLSATAWPAVLIYLILRMQHFVSVDRQTDR